MSKSVYSTFSENLSNYNNFVQNQINYDLINLNLFNKKQVEYVRMLPFSPNKVVGLEDTDEEDDTNIEIYNIKNLNIETTLYFHPPEKVFYNEQFNIILFLSKKYIYIVNQKDFSIKQEFSANHVIKKEKEKNKNSYRYNSSLWSNEREEEEDEDEDEDEFPIEFIYADVLSNDSFAVIFNGDIRRLGDNNLELLYYNIKFQDIQFINFDYGNLIQP